MISTLLVETMIELALRHIFWFGARIGVTLACILTVQHVITQEGYRVEFKSLFISTICLIIVTRFWSPKQPTKEEER